MDEYVTPEGFVLPLPGLHRPSRRALPGPGMSSIKGTPPMKVATEREGNIVTLKVEHHDHQSFSRAVDPRASRGMRSYMVAHRLRDVALIDVKYAVEEPAPRRCISVYTYEVRG